MRVHELNLNDEHIEKLEDHLRTEDSSNRRTQLPEHLVVLGYLAANNGIRSGPEMAYTWEQMQEFASERHGEGAKLYGAITRFDEVPKVISETRLKTTGPYANEPFDAIIYKEA